MYAWATLSVYALALGSPTSLARGAPNTPFAATLPVQDYNTVQWIAQKVDGAYADATMDIVIVNAGEPDDDEEELERMSVCARTCVCVDSLPSSASPTTQLFE